MRKLHELRAAQTWTEVSRGVCFVPTAAFYAGSSGNRKLTHVISACSPVQPV